jgi:hypothetical protein
VAGRSFARLECAGNKAAFALQDAEVDQMEGERGNDVGKREMNWLPPEKSLRNIETSAGLSSREFRMFESPVKKGAITSKHGAQ